MKKRGEVWIGVFVLLFMLSGIVVAAKYVMYKEQTEGITPGKVHISSDVLSEDTNIIQKSWNGKSAEIGILLYNYADLHSSDCDVQMELSVDTNGNSDITCSVNFPKDTIAVEGGKQSLPATIDITASEGVEFQEDDIIEIKVTVTEKVYQQSLTAIWKFQVHKQQPVYQIQDHGAYLTCSIYIPEIERNETQKINLLWDREKFTIDSTNPLIYGEKGMEMGSIDLEFFTGSMYELFFYKQDQKVNYTKEAGVVKQEDGVYSLEFKPEREGISE